MVNNNTQVFELMRDEARPYLGKWERNRTMSQRRSGYSPNYIKWYNTIYDPIHFNGWIWTNGDRTLTEVHPLRRRTAVFNATWSESYDGNGNIKPSADTKGRLYQGQDSSGGNRWGIERSLIGFNTSEVQETLKGTTIEKVEIYLKNEHVFNARSGMKTTIVSHNFSSRPSNFNYVPIATNTSFRKSDGKWVRLHSLTHDQLKNGSITGFGLYANTTDSDYYGYFAGATTNERPQLRVTYMKNIYVGMAGHEYLTDNLSGKEPEYYIHTVKKQNSVYNEATSLGVSVSQLRAWNNLSSGVYVYEGNKLKVYKESEDVSKPAATPLYTSVKQGENLDLVASRLMRQGVLPNNLTLARSTLMSLNGYSNSNPLLYPGDQIMYSRGSS